MVDGWSIEAADSTMRKIEEARGTPKVNGRFVTRMKTVPRLLSEYALAASEADVDEAGYSPPVPKPVMPRATVNIQNIPVMVVPLDPADKARPSIIMLEVRMMANFRPR